MGNCNDIEEWALRKGHCPPKIKMTNITPKINQFSYDRPLPKINQFNYTRSLPKTQEEKNINEKIDYILYGLEHDLFPANYRHNGKRWSWGVGTDIPSEITVDTEVFAFDRILHQNMIKVIKYSKSLKGNYGDSGPPQLILNYVNNNFILTIECYKRNGELYMLRNLLVPNENMTRMYIRTIIEENLNLYDLYNEIATYENEIKY